VQTAGALEKRFRIRSGNIGMTGSDRLVPIDVLKSVGIVTVVWIHTVVGTERPAEHYVLELARFAVPGFLAVSGYLYASREPVALATTGRRLRRLLVPYLVASALAQLYLWSLGKAHSWPQIGRDLLYASSFGPYYYVFAITSLVLLTPWLAQIPARMTLALWIALLVDQVRAFASVLALPPGTPEGSLFWFVRDPSLMGLFFLGGWLCSFYRRPLAVACSKHWSTLLAMSGGMAMVLSVLAVREEERLIAPLAGWFNTFVVVAVVALASLRARRLPRALRFLSDASYTFYLYHLFFVYLVLGTLPSPASWGSRLLLQATAMGAGLIGPGLLVVASRRVLGARSRAWIGA
jgi:surface polysaccharide O-acyltransferase-like enzyme